MYQIDLGDYDSIRKMHTTMYSEQYKFVGDVQVFPDNFFLRQFTSRVWLEKDIYFDSKKSKYFLDNLWVEIVPDLVRNAFSATSET